MSGGTDAAPGPVGGDAEDSGCRETAGGVEPQVWRRDVGPGDALEPASVAVAPAGGAFVAYAGGRTVGLDAAGDIRWTLSLGSLVARGPEGHPRVAGSFEGTLDLGAVRLVSAGGRDVFVAELDGNGGVVRAHRIGTVSDDIPVGLAVDADGSSVISGSGIGTFKLDAQGAVLWQRPFYGRVALDEAGNVVVTGGFTGAMDFGAGPVVGAGGEDVFVVKLDAAGEPLFVRVFGDAAAIQHGEGVAVDGDGNVLVTGVLEGTIDFGGGALEVPAGACPAEVWCQQAGFVVKLDGAGRHVWSRSRFPVWALPGVAVNSSGDVVVSGAYPGNAPPYRTPLLVALSGEDGAERWAAETLALAASGGGAGQDVAFDECGGVLWALSTPPAPNAVERSFVAKLSPWQ